MGAAAEVYKPQLSYPVDKAPEPGSAVQVAEGVHWMRLPLPFALNHINIWLLEDGEGWTVVDTGIKSETLKGMWEALLAGYMGGRPVTRVIATHLHPDHTGLAGWLCRRFGARLWMSRTDYVMCRMLALDTGREAPPEAEEFYRAAGYTDDQIAAYKARFGGFGKGVEQMPDAYRRIKDGDVLTIGGRRWEAIAGGGHAPEHISLACEELRVLISGDQALPTISSNVSVWPTEPDGDPLSDWLAACARVRERVSDDVLVCPAHQKVFYGLHARMTWLIEEHEENLTALLAILDKPKRAVDVFPALFRREITGDLLGMATGESMAHLNCLITRGLAAKVRDGQGVDWYRRV